MGMKELFQDWRKSKLSEFEKGINGCLQAEEKLESWTFVFSAPNEIIDWLPWIDTYYKRKRQDFILALTNHAVVLIPLRKNKLTEVSADGAERFPREKIQALKVDAPWYGTKLSIIPVDQPSRLLKTDFLEDAQEIQQRLM